ncbi:MAG: acyltransferase [Paludibacteraceae bacterium]|nr:acyltransferase [Paludibacteraceae bacterium]
MELQIQEQPPAVKVTERLDYIDIVKGLSIISIVLLHFEDGLIPSCVNAYIGGYMITAFYVAVGWIGAARNKDIPTKDLVSKRWVQLGKPYIYWSAIILIFDVILWTLGHFDTYIIERELYKTVTLRGIGTLWFLPALFGGEILWNWSKNKNNTFVYVVILIAIVAYHVAFHYYFEGKNDTMSRMLNAPFQSLSSMGDAWIGIAFGYSMFKLCSNFLNNNSTIVIFLAGLLLSLVAYISANYNPYILLDKYICPLLGPLGLFFIFKVVKIPYLNQYLKYWGVNSLGLMVIHFSLLLELSTIIQNKIDGTTDQTLYGWPSVCHFIICLIVSYFIVEAIKKYCPQLLGKAKPANK